MRKRDNESSSEDLIDLLAFESRLLALHVKRLYLPPGEVLPGPCIPRSFENYVSLIDRVLIPVIIERWSTIGQSSFRWSEGIVKPSRRCSYDA